MSVSCTSPHHFPNWKDGFGFVEAVCAPNFHVIIFFLQSRFAGVLFFAFRPLQGTAADIIKTAMVIVARRLDEWRSGLEDGLDCPRLVMQVGLLLPLCHPSLNKPCRARDLDYRLEAQMVGIHFFLSLVSSRCACRFSTCGSSGRNWRRFTMSLCWSVPPVKKT